MYGLHKTLTRPRRDGLAWKLVEDGRTGEWYPTLYVANIDRAMIVRPQVLLRALNGTSLVVRSMMYARMFISRGQTNNMLVDIEQATLKA